MSKFDEILAKLQAGEEGAREELDALVSARANAAAEEATAALAAKNDLLIGQKKDLGKKLAQFVDRDGQPLTPQQIQEMAELAEEARQARDAKGGDDEAREALRKRYETPLLTRIGEIESERDEALRFLDDRLISGEMLEALVKGGVDPEVAPAVRAMLREQGGYEVKRIEKDGRTVFRGQYTGDDEIPVPLSEHMKNWLGSDSAKKFITAPRSHGGGAEGGDSRNNGSEPNPFAQKTRNMTAAAELLRNNPAKAARLAAEAGVSL